MSGRAVVAWGVLLAGSALACERAADSTRIAIAGGSLTEIVYFLGEADRIVAVDITSNHPPEASRHPSVGYVRALSTEGLLSLRPTLILGEDDMGPAEVLTQIQRTGVEISRVPEVHTAPGILRKVRCVAAVLGLADAAEEAIGAHLVPQVETLATLAATAAHARPRVALLLGSPQGAALAAGRGTSGDGLLRMVQAENVFADVTGWKPMSPEALATANPDFVLVATRGAAERDAARSAVSSSTALRLTGAAREGRTVTLDGMALLGFGPRTLSTAVEVARMLQALPAG